MFNKDHMTSAQKIHVMLLLSLIPFLMGTGIDLYVPSLPAIVRYFNTQNHFVQYTISFYVLGYAVGQIILGMLSDSFGRKKILIISGIVYTVISFLSALSPNIFCLISYRFLQGFAIAGPAVIARAIATDCFSGLALTKVMTYISICWALGPIIGPVIGGYLQYFFGWQASFYFFGIYGLLTFIYAAIVLAETNINLLPFHPVSLYQSLKEVVMHPIFLLCSLIASLIYAMLVVFNIVAPFLIQVDLKYSVIAFGHIALLLGLGYFLGNLGNRFIVHYIAPTKITLFSLIGAILSSFSMLISGIYIALNLYTLLIPTIILFIFCGFIFPNMMAISVSLFPNKAGTASAIFGSWVAGGVFIMSLIATTLNTTTQLHVSIMYLVMSLICLAIFALFLRVYDGSQGG